MNLSEAGALGDPTLAGKQLPSPPKPAGAYLGQQTNLGLPSQQQLQAARPAA